MGDFISDGDSFWWRRSMVDQGEVLWDNHTMVTFDRVLDSVEKLSLDEQEVMLATVQRRVAEKRRAEVVEAVKEARAEFKSGKVKAKSPADIMKLIGR